MPYFELPPGSYLAAAITERWTWIPLRIPSWWTIHQNSVDARRLPSGRYEVNDSEDLFWASRPTAPDEEERIHLDAGWYRTLFRLVFFAHTFDDLGIGHETDDLEEFIATLESWLASPEAVIGR
ncbi:hypothetical protein O4J56_02375 [Nocardiopsis sp. RSe5-2]|uniref:SUKH-4 immunity protein of toxin-antitoxin system n=1 Tax=Nocardiopsis endophytica TaxID=3018445 RepID=A0ABT4TXQ2_9ACTN|nr:hypothetical protein [Nocardiopsis endophytica]MDA2809473.1 hypothetical protein [Nocardiopsis endophytica]